MLQNVIIYSILILFLFYVLVSITYLNKTIRKIHDHLFEVELTVKSYNAECPECPPHPDVSDEIHDTEFIKRIAFMREEIEKASEERLADELHPLVKNLPHDTIKHNNPNDLEVAE